MVSQDQKLKNFKKCSISKKRQVQRLYSNDVYWLSRIIEAEEGEDHIKAKWQLEM